MQSEEMMEQLVGMHLCDAAVKEIMPLSESESFETIKQKYITAVDEYPDNWPELTLGTMKYLLAHHNTTSDKQNLFDFLEVCAASLDLINS